MRHVAIPALLRAARGSYGDAIRTDLLDAGFDDMPRNGVWILAGMERGATAAEMLGGLDVTKQAASQLVDALVLRGYLTRETNPDDRRRMIIDLTERGRAAAAVIKDAIEAVDAELEARITPEQMEGLEAGLLALAEIKEARG